MANTLKDVMRAGLQDGLRGELTEASSRGLSSSTKVTNDPTAEPIPEAPGAILSDSLAAESKRAGGSFGLNNPRTTEPIQQSSHGTTTNVSGVRSATKLAPAKDAAHRHGDKHGDNHDEGGKTSYNPDRKSKTKVGEDDEADGEGARGAKASASKRDSAHQHQHQHQVESYTNAEQAPSYTSSSISELRHDQKPKGLHLKEGGDIDGSEKNTSFTADIGSSDDPSLLAEERFRAKNALNVSDAAEKQSGVVDGKFYGVLGRNEEA